MANFIENLRNNLANWFERNEVNTIHASKVNPQAPSGVSIWSEDGEERFGGPAGRHSTFSGKHDMVPFIVPAPEAKKAYEELRRGRSALIGQNEIAKGGIYGTRFLGRTPNDFMSPEYFSDEEVSDSYGPKSVFLYGGKFGKNGAKIKASYDDKGAIAQIDVFDASKFDGDGNYKLVESHKGANDISNYFKSLGWDSDGYSVYTGQQTTKEISSGSYGKDLSDFTPTTLLGSESDSEPINLRANKRWSLDNSRNRRAFEEYYRRYGK